jgi:small multidrug resistance pump
VNVVLSWLYVAAAIAAELTGTITLRRLAAAPAWGPVMIVVLAYALSYTCLGLALRRLDLGVVYALWAGVGTAALAGVGAVAFGEHLGWRAIAGMTVIVIGVVVLVTSGTVRHTP